MIAGGTILDRIAEHKREEVAARKSAHPLAAVVDEAASASTARDFGAALLDPHRSRPRVIAEIKRRSPSRGPLRATLDPREVAITYEQNGAAALSVLTDGPFFGGSFDDLRAARGAVSLPVLCKDFMLDDYQLYEARAAGADAILLIVGLLDDAQLHDYREIAEGLGMSALVEVHDEREVERAVRSGASIIGVNNRDLRTFEVSLETTRSLLPLIPRGTVTISESGIHDSQDRLSAGEMGADAVLVGEGLISAPDIALATREMCGPPASVLEGKRP